MRTTLVTGFEPFGGSSLNTSAQVVAALAARRARGMVTAILPTSYRRAQARIDALVRMHQPGTVLLLGLASADQQLRLEQVALNLDDAAAPDNDGEVRLRTRIVADAPVGYWSTLPLDAGRSRAAGR